MKRAAAMQAVAALAAGAALTCAFAPFGWWPLAVLCPAALLWLWQAAAPRRAAWLGFCFGGGHFAAGTWWLYISIHDMADAPVWLALLLVALLVVIMALYYALLGALVARLLPAAGAWRLLAGAPALWLLIEWLRGWLFTGFPWLSLGYGFTDTWLAGWAPVVGVYGLSAWALCAGGAIVLLVLRTQRRAALAASVTLALLAAAAPWPGRHEWTHAQGAAVSVAVVQGATPQNIKWQSGNREAIRDTYARLNAEALGARLVVWPEAAIPQLAELMPEFLARTFRAANLHGSDVVMGVLRLGRNDEVYNSVLALTAPVAFYDKRHLVPYSEYFPVPDFVRRLLQRLNLPYSDISRGREDQPPLRAGGLELAPTVCYEDAFGNAQRRLSAASDALLNVTNDAWFGHSPARYQHFQMSRLRAIEAQRYLIRAANDGVSAVVGPRGEVLVQAREYEEAVMGGTVRARRGLTPYLRVGDWPLLAAAAAALALAALKRRRELKYNAH